MIDIARSAVAYETEPLLAPFGFKAGYLDELWQTVVVCATPEGHEGVGVGVQSVLWSDAEVFAAHSASAGNCMMHLMTERAMKLVERTSFETPVEVIEGILPEVMEYGRRVSGRDALRTTFALNAMVPLDFALWMLYAKIRGFSGFDELIPEAARPALSSRHERLGVIPLVTYDVSLPKVRRLAEEGCFLIKIKIGADPDRDGDPEKMLTWDIARVRQIHEALREYTTPHTASGRIAYYLDANGRYDSADRLLRLLDALDAESILDRLLLLEEPFPEGVSTEVRGMGVRVAADESAHTVEDVRRLIALGYGAIALKPIAKTLSMSFLMAREAAAQGVPCFCADLTVGPVTLEWNQAFASRLAPLPGLRLGVLESNGRQNYARWEAMLRYAGQAPWLTPDGGVFHLGEDFQGGGILTPSPHYRALARL